MSTIRETLVDAERRLSNAGIDSASVDSAQLLAFVLGVSRSHLILQDSIDEEDRHLRDAETAADGPVSTY